MSARRASLFQRIRLGESDARVRARRLTQSTAIDWFDRAGKTSGTLGEGGVDINLSLSPDERHVAVALRSGRPENLDIWTIDIARNLRNRVTSMRNPKDGRSGRRMAHASCSDAARAA